MVGNITYYTYIYNKEDRPQSELNFLITRVA